MQTAVSGHKISILMNCRDGEEYLRQAIDSVYSQTHQNFEIIFIDNQSKDQTPAIAKSYDERLKYIRTPEPMTLYQARAYSVEFCTGDYFCVLDADDYWVPTKLAEQLAFISKNPGVDFVYGLANYYYQKRPFKTFFVNRVVGFKNLFVRQGYRSIEDLVSHYDINLQTIMVKMAFVKKCGFNSAFNYIGDFDFHLRIMVQFQVKPYLVKRIFSTTRIHSSRLSITTPGKWLREIKVLLVKVIIPNTERKHAKAFMKEIAKKRYIYFLTLGQPLKAINQVKSFLVSDPYLLAIVSYKTLGTYFRKLRNA